MALPINESVWLATDWTSHFFVEKRRTIYNWEEKIRLNLIEIDTQDDDGVYEDFDNSYDYKEEWKEAVRYNDYEDSLETFIDEVRENYWDYIDSVLTGCEDSDIIDWVQENVNADYWKYNVTIISEHEIKLREDWEFDNYILRVFWDIDTELRDDSVFSDILCELGKLDYKYVKLT